MITCIRRQGQHKKGMDEMEMEYYDALTDVCLKAIKKNYDVPNLSDERFGLLLNAYNDAIQKIVDSKIDKDELIEFYMKRLDDYGDKYVTLVFEESFVEEWIKENVNDDGKKVTVKEFVDSYYTSDDVREMESDYELYKMRNS